VNKDRYIFQ